MNKRVILTGGTGFVGANLCRRLLREGHEVHLLIRPGFRPWRIEAVRSDLKLHEIRFSDKDALTRTIGKIRPDWVFHLAAYGAYASQTNVQQMVETNITGTINLVEACLATGFESFVHTGSSSEYGFKDHAPSETELPEPNSPYAVTKASATLFCSYTAKTRDVNLTTLRLYSAYGPYEEPTRLIPTLILRGMAGALPPLADPEIARDFVAVEDVAEACCLAANRSEGERGAVYNVGTGVQTSLRKVVEVAQRILPVKDEPRWGTMPSRGWDTRVWVSDPRKIRDELGWEPQYEFDDGFRRFVDWLHENPEILDFYRKCVENLRD